MVVETTCVEENVVILSLVSRFTVGKMEGGYIMIILQEL
jgi:hypothetical protein